MHKFGKKQGGGRRCAAREEAPLTAVFTTITYSHSALLVDVSCTGARLRGDYLPSKGEEIMLSVENLRAFGIVVWSRRGECGVRFELPLEPLDIHDLRQKVRERAGLPRELRDALEDWSAGLAR
jgi:hypothetical protein